MELNPSEGEEAQEGLEDWLAHPDHACGEGRADGRAQELRVGQHTTAHCKQIKVKSSWRYVRDVITTSNNTFHHSQDI